MLIPVQMQNDYIWLSLLFFFLLLLCGIAHFIIFDLLIFDCFNGRARITRLMFLFFEEQLPSSRRKSTGDVCQKGLELQKPFDLLVDARNEVHRLMLDGSGSCFVHRPKLVKECLGLVSSWTLFWCLVLAFALTACVLYFVGCRSSRVMHRGGLSWI